MSAGAAKQFLIVDDEIELLDEVASYFLRRGEMVATASSFTEARRALGDRRQPIDVLITDARMPDGNGIDLIREQLQAEENRCLCVLMTGHMDQSQIAAEIRTVRVFFKPFSVATLYREVKAMIGQEQPMLAVRAA
jgi:two-component system response regulator PilR (NtrC family)